MANTFIIEIRSKGFGPAKSNTKALKGSIAKLRQEVTKHKKALEQAKIGSKSFEKAQKDLEASTKKLEVGLGKVTSKVAGYNKEEIVNQAEKIGTYKISIEPYQDCCSYFVPSHPETKAKLHRIQSLEKKVDLDKIIGTEISKLEKKEIILYE